MLRSAWIFTLILLVIAGCGPAPGAKPNAAKPVKSSTTANRDAATDTDSDSASEEEASTTDRPRFSAVQLGGDNSAATGKTASTPGEKRVDDVITALKPLQVLLGKWRGTTNKKFKGFSAVEELEWVWDFQTNKAQPALIVQSDKSPYIRSGRLTYLPDSQQFELSLKTPEGTDHTLVGEFEKEPEEFTGDDNKPHKTYKLLLTEESSGEELWQVAFNQQENNRYLVEIFQKKGTGRFQRVDTVGTQRTGTSFAASDEDYGDRKCIISGGLGTIAVSYEGKSYYVCCTGCEAAFKEDPKRWLAKLAEEEKEMKKAE